MKRLYQLVSVVAVTLFIPIAASLPASAKPVCEVGFTGPDTNNMCVSKEKYKCAVTNVNEVKITNSTDQVAASGEVSVSGSDGDAVSGSVTSDDSVTFSVVINNSNADDNEPGTCQASVVVPAKEVPETPKTPEKPKPSGQGSATPVKPAQTVTPAALPVTSGSEAPAVIASLGMLVVVIAAAIAYRQP